MPFYLIGKDFATKTRIKKLQLRKREIRNSDLPDFTCFFEVQ